MVLRFKEICYTFGATLSLHISQILQMLKNLNYTNVSFDTIWSTDCCLIVSQVIILTQKPLGKELSIFLTRIF